MPLQYGDLLHLTTVIEESAKGARVKAMSAMLLRERAGSPALATPDQPNPPTPALMLKQAADLDRGASAGLQQMLMACHRLAELSQQQAPDPGQNGHHGRLGLVGD